MPPANASDILSDVEDLWQWVHDGLPQVLSARAPEIEVDLDKILVEGNSAGGFCAAHLAMDHPTSIRAAILVYPMLDCMHIPWTGERVKALGLDPIFTGQALDDEIERIGRAGSVSARYEDSIPFMVSFLEGNKFAGMFGDNEEHNPSDKVKKMKQPLPRMCA